jgi:acyl phosphate:glycerol-3-phosphate acyltransferase
MIMLSDLILVILAYLLGTVSFGLILARLKGGVDLRGQGSGSIGATNVARTMGKRAGIIALVGDCAKGLLAVLLAQAWGSSVWTVAAVALAAVLGHLFPWYAGFRGGKGVATALGVFMPTLPLPLLGALLVFIAVVLVWRYVSAGSILAALLLPILAVVLANPLPLTLAAAVIAVLILAKHQSNLQRLFRGQESKFF